MLPGFSCMDLIIKSNHEETMGYITQHCCKVVRSMQICSPTTFSTGTRLTWTRQKFPGPTRYENWPNASIKCIDSISPHQECHCHYARWEKILSLHWADLHSYGNIRRNYSSNETITQTSGVPCLPSTSFIATHSIQSWIPSVICGPTWTFSSSSLLSFPCQWQPGVRILQGKMLLTSRR